LVVWCDSVSYERALQLQLEICELKKRGFGKDVLLLLEHPPVITLGRSADRKNLLVNEAQLQTRGVELYATDRGGDITFHGPGQLVGYPILALGQGERDVRAYMRKLEESLMRLLKGFGIQSERNAGYTGVWTAQGKIAAMGVHISRWITRHGFALNVNTDLTFFDMIVPCGISGKAVTSMQKLTGRRFDVRTIAGKYALEFGTVYERSMIQVGEAGLIGELERYRGEIKRAVASSPAGP
jgi:lipoyl(octanoyl) transferase